MTGEAGRQGPDVRSDLHVALEPRDGGGLEIELVSKVALYYGDAIREQVRGVLGALGVRDARVTVRDAGALPFAIAARVETAARRAGVRGGDARPPRLAAVPAASTRDRLRRSRLYVPGSEPKFMINAGLYAADGIILDLEDSVHPAEKDAARLLVRNALRTVDFGGAERMVRINQLPLGLDDIDLIVPEAPDLLLLPKVETAEQVREVQARVDEVARRAGLARGPWLMPILESALGIENAFSIAAASESVVALTIGLEDYTADVGVVKTPEGQETLYARMRLVNAARAARLAAIDSVYGDVGDIDGLRAWALRSRAMGFEGMGCVHPRQIAVIHAAYAPGPAEIDKALRIVAAYDEAQAKGLAVVSLGSKMIDPPVVERALGLVRRARAMGLVPPAPQEASR
ncbi:MAG: citrate lyase ACP [Acidobacteria bacterium]|nr:citrate lyase ACP [Acidobacteriota bacterium]